MNLVFRHPLATRCFEYLTAPFGLQLARPQVSQVALCHWKYIRYTTYYTDYTDLYYRVIVGVCHSCWNLRDQQWPLHDLVSLILSKAWWSQSLRESRDLRSAMKPRRWLKLTTCVQVIPTSLSFLGTTNTVKLHFAVWDGSSFLWGTCCEVLDATDFYGTQGHQLGPLFQVRKGLLGFQGWTFWCFLSERFNFLM